ncbi:hypothetical protein HUF15_40600 [Streptomyces samsunensis]|uniref:hypothetical protein n=1 Tax=Streptomyces malaysiensis TaxID=92644 RepID=UPI0015819021|nr:hypothetical protein [Streptomyces samsunensis]NUH42921.1 hypothetical protein [Streptomyces samsunensis]
MSTTGRTYADVMAELSELRAALASVMADVREEYGAEEVAGYHNMARYVAALTGAPLPVASPVSPRRHTVRTALRGAWERLSAPFRRLPSTPSYV